MKRWVVLKVDSSNWVGLTKEAKCFPCWSSGVDQEMNFLGQNGGNVTDDVSAQQIEECAALWCADDQMRCPHRCCNVHDGVCGQVTHRVARPKAETLRLFACIFKNRDCLVIFSPCPPAVAGCYHGLLADKQ